MSDYLLTESGDTLVTERGNYIVYDSFTEIDWPLLADVKTYLNISGTADDTYLQRHIYATIEAIEGYLGRQIPLQVQTDTIRPIESDKSFGYASQVQLKRYPISEVIEIYGNGELLDIDSTIQYEGILSAELNAYNVVTVKYHGGYSVLPYDLENVFYEMMKSRYESKDNSSVNQELRKRTIPNVITEEYFAPDSYDRASVMAYTGVLEKYRAMYV